MATAFPLAKAERDCGQKGNRKNEDDIQKDDVKFKLNEDDIQKDDVKFKLKLMKKEAAPNALPRFLGRGNGKGQSANNGTARWISPRVVPATAKPSLYHLARAENWHEKTAELGSRLPGRPPEAAATTAPPTKPEALEGCCLGRPPEAAATTAPSSNKKEREGNKAAHHAPPPIPERYKSETRLAENGGTR